MALVLMMASMLVVLTVMRGIAIKFLWGWFLVPLGVVPIDFVWGMGIAMTVAFITGTDAIKQDQGEPKADAASIADSLVKLFTRTLLAFGIGYLIHLFM